MGNKSINFGSGECLAKELGRRGITELWVRNQRVAEVEYSRTLRTTFTQLGTIYHSVLAAKLEKNGLNVSLAELTFDHKEWFAGIVKASRPHLLSMAQVGASTELYLHQDRTENQISQEMQRGIPVWLNWKAGTNSVIPSDVMSRIDNWCDNLLKEPYWKDCAESVREQVAEKIADGIRKGQSTKEVAAQLETVLGPNGSARRAMLIARTESTGALNAGHAISRDKLTEMGILKAKEWFCIKDKKTRPDHEEASGQQVPPNGKFIVGGEKCDHPGDTSLSAKQRCNCRCTVISVMKTKEELDAELNQPEPATTPPPTVNPPTIGPIPDVAPVVPMRPTFPLNTGDQVSVIKNPVDEKHIIGVLGRAYADKELARMVGAAPGATVRMKVTETAKYGHTVTMHTAHPGYESQRVFRRNPETGNLEVVNEFMVSNPGHADTAMTSFATQVDQLSTMGVDRILATGKKGTPKRDGSYVLPKMGFDGPIPRGLLRVKLPPSLSSAEKVSDLMKTEEGRKWWREHGTDVDLTFDLSSSSQSRSVFDSYVSSRARQDAMTGKSLEPHEPLKRYEEPPLLSEMDEHLLDMIWDVIGRVSPPKSQGKARPMGRVKADEVQGGVDQVSVGAPLAPHLYAPFDTEEEIMAAVQVLIPDSEDTRWSIEMYQKNYRRIQSELRKQGIQVMLSDDVREWVGYIDITMGRHKTDRPIVGYRIAAHEAFGVDDILSLRGYNFRDDAYNSCILSKDEAAPILPLADDKKPGVLVAIRIPPNTSSAFDWVLHEQEIHSIILPRGATYRIIDIKEFEGRIELVTEVVALASQQTGKAYTGRKNRLEKLRPYDCFGWYSAELQMLTPWSNINAQERIDETE